MPSQLRQTRISMNSLYKYSVHLCIVKVEYLANKNPLQISEKIAYVGQRLMYPIIKK